MRGVFTFSWRGAGALGPRRGPRRLNNKRGAAKRQEDRTMSKGPGPGGSAASSAPPAATAQVLQAQPEKPQHYTYVEPPPAARARLTSAASVSHARRESARRPLPPPRPPPPARLRPVPTCWGRSQLPPTATNLWSGCGAGNSVSGGERRRRALGVRSAHILGQAFEAYLFLRSSPAAPGTCGVHKVQDTTRMSS